MLTFFQHRRRKSNLHPCRHAHVYFQECTVFVPYFRLSEGLSLPFVHTRIEKTTVLHAETFRLEGEKHTKHYLLTYYFKG